ncbi:MAG: APC family permease, partial [Muribaculaceae bacterium]|nr:APC family permease [Muribaculaceae bacterium]
VIFCSVLIWVMFWIVSRGIKTAKIVHSLLALIKVVMLVFIIVVLVLMFKADLFEADLWGLGPGQAGVGEQVRRTMMVTLFCFFGVEGAVMMSARAKSPKDVGRAGVAGFFISLVLYMAVSLLSFGLMSKARLAGLPDPSIAYILRDVCGEWAYWFVIISVIIALLGGWVAWTLVVSQVPYEASLVKILPRAFSRTNSHGMPAFGLVASSIAMEVFLLIVVMADDVYLAALHITGLMIIPCYFFTALFLLKTGKTLPIKALALIATLFCVWMAYAGGLVAMSMTSLFYLAGIWFYVKVRRETRAPGAPVFSRRAKVVLGMLVVLALFSVALTLASSENVLGF